MAFFGKKPSPLGSLLSALYDQQRPYGLPQPNTLSSILQQYAELRRPGNINLNNRPVVRNPDGRISTIRTIGINVDGLEYNIPTVSEDGRIMSDEEAVQQFYRTGRHFGAYDTTEEARRAAERLHEDQSRQYRGRR